MQGDMTSTPLPSQITLWEWRAVSKKLVGLAVSQNYFKMEFKDD
jgi:hypothetical protein